VTNGFSDRDESGWSGFKAAARYGRGAGALLAGLKDPAILSASPRA